MEIMCLRAACRYDPEKETITMHNGVCLHKSQLKSEGLGLLVEPIFEFAVGLSKLKLDKTELALLASVLLMQSGKFTANPWFFWLHALVICCNYIF